MDDIAEFDPADLTPKERGVLVAEMKDLARRTKQLHLVILAATFALALAERKLEVEFPEPGFEHDMIRDRLIDRYGPDREPWRGH